MKKTCMSDSLWHKGIYHLIMVKDLSSYHKKPLCQTHSGMKEFIILS